MHVSQKTQGTHMKNALFITLLLFSTPTFTMEEQETTTNLLSCLEPIEDEAKKAELLSFALPQPVETLINGLKEVKKDNKGAVMVLVNSHDKEQARLWPYVVAASICKDKSQINDFPINDNNPIATTEHSALLVRNLAALYTYYTKQYPSENDDEKKIEAFVNYLKKPLSTGKVFLICGLLNSNTNQMPKEVLEAFIQLQVNFHTNVILPQISDGELERHKIVKEAFSGKDNCYLWINDKYLFAFERNRKLVEMTNFIPTKHLGDFLNNLPFKKEWIWSFEYLDEKDLRKSLNAASEKLKRGQIVKDQADKNLQKIKLEYPCLNCQKHSESQYKHIVDCCMLNNQIKYLCNSCAYCKNISHCPDCNTPIQY